MEFSYKITEPEYRRFARAQNRSVQTILIRFVRGLVLFWAAVFAAVVLLWAVVNHFSPEASSQKPGSAIAVQEAAPSTSSKVSQVASFGAFFAVLGVSFFSLFVFPRLKLRRQYRKDPVMQGTFHVTLLPNSIAIENTSGLSIKDEWNAFNPLREKKGLVIIRALFGTSFPINLTSLSDLEKAEVRRILSAIRKKR